MDDSEFAKGWEGTRSRGFARFVVVEGATFGICFRRHHRGPHQRVARHIRSAPRPCRIRWLHGAWLPHRIAGLAMARKPRQAIHRGFAERVAASIASSPHGGREATQGAGDETAAAKSRSPRNLPAPSALIRPIAQLVTRISPSAVRRATARLPAGSFADFFCVMPGRPEAIGTHQPAPPTSAAGFRQGRQRRPKNARTARTTTITPMMVRMLYMLLLRYEVGARFR